MPRARCLRALPSFAMSVWMLWVCGTAASETIDLQSEPRLVLEGEAVGEEFGAALAVGDFDGDGLDDLAVGAPSADGPSGERGAGRVYLYFGSVSRSTTPPDGADAVVPDVLLIGTLARRELGERLAAGDIDGDGRADLVIGAWQGDGPGGDRAGCGEAAILLGRDRADFRPTVRFGRDEADLTIFGAGPNDHLAGEMTIGDFDGDGLADVAVGAFYGDGPGEDRHHAGEIAIFFGEPDMKSRSPRFIDLAEEKLPTVYGREASDTFGRGVAAGDVDGDGRDDLLAGAYYADGPANDRINGGEAYIVFGAVRDRFAGGIDLAVEPPVIVYGAEGGDLVGRSVGAADLDGDGFADFLIGAHAAAADPSVSPTANEGAFLVFFGRPRHEWAAEIDLRAGSDMRFGGRAEGDQFSRPINTGPWRDGREIALVSACDSDGGEVRRSNAGEVYILGGLERSAAPLCARAADRALLTVVGLDVGDQAGVDAAVLDWNGDGRPELALGAPGGAGTGHRKPRCGEVILYTPR